MTRHRDINEPTVLLDGPPLEPGLLVVRTSDTDHPHCWSGQRQPIDRFRQREENPGGIPSPLADVVSWDPRRVDVRVARDHPASWSSISQRSSALARAA